MSLRFELGDPQEPRGHALLYAHVSGGTEHIVATYCIVLPLQFSIGKFLPPMLMGQIPLDMAGEGSMAALPIPPLLDDVADLATLRQLAERRGDDLCDLGTIALGDDSQRMTFAAEACAEYGEAYQEYRARWPQSESTDTIASSSIPLDDMEMDDVLATVLPDRDRLGEIARLIGQARYAMDVRDQRQLDETTKTMQRLAHALPEKYRGEQLVEAALRSDAAGPRLAGLYLQRAYKLLNEEYIDIPPIEREIRALLGEHDGGEQPTTPTP